MTTALKTALFAKLKTAVPLVSNRVYQIIAPQGAEAPYLVFTQISSVDDHTHDGYSGVQTSRYQFACYGTTAASAQAVADEVIAGLRDWASVSASFKEGVTDGYEDDVKLFHVIVDFLMWHT